MRLIRLNVVFTKRKRENFKFKTEPYICIYHIPHDLYWEHVLLYCTPSLRMYPRTDHPIRVFDVTPPQLPSLSCGHVSDSAPGSNTYVFVSWTNWTVFQKRRPTYRFKNLIYLYIYSHSSMHKDFHSCKHGAQV